MVKLRCDAVFLPMIIAICIMAYNYIDTNKATKSEAVNETLILSQDNEKQIEIPEETYFVTSDDLHNNFYSMIQALSSIKDPTYINKVASAFITLLDNEKNHKQYVLYYISLCSVESNFKMKSVSSCGAIGISQVMWAVWGKLLNTKYGLTKHNFMNDINCNVLAGYIVWRHYLETNNYNVKLAAFGYLGAKNKAYYYKFLERYSQLSNIIMKELFN